MPLIVGDSIRRKESGDLIPDEDREVIICSARVELTTPIKGEGPPICITDHDGDVGNEGWKKNRQRDSRNHHDQGNGTAGEVKYPCRL